MTGFRLWHDTRLGKTDVTTSFVKMMRQPTDPKRKGRHSQQKKAKQLDPMVLEPPNDCQGGEELEIRGRQ